MDTRPPAPPAIEPLFIGVGGHVVAIDIATGQELWRTRLKRGTFVTVLRVGPRVVAGANGELFCLDAASGEILWHNRLPGLGWGLIAMGGGPDEASHAAMVAQVMAASAAAGAAATTAAAAT